MGTRNAISMVQILRLQEVPLGPGNAFIKCVMATCDHPSGLVHGIAYPSLGRPGLRTHWQLPLPEEEKRSSASSSLQDRSWRLISRQSNCIGEIPTAKSMGDSWSAGLPVAPPTSASCHSAVSHGSAAQKRNANDVICYSRYRPRLPMPRGFKRPAHVHIHPQALHSRPNA